MIAIPVIAMTLALVSAPTAQVPPAQQVQPVTLSDKLIGAWEVTEVQDPKKQKLPVGSTLVFARDGTMKIFYGLPAAADKDPQITPRPAYTEHTWSLKNNEITINRDLQGKKTNQTITISQLTDDALITTNSDGNWIKYSRRGKYHHN